jgi:hypothetical protein
MNVGRVLDDDERGSSQPIPPMLNTMLTWVLLADD